MMSANMSPYYWEIQLHDPNINYRVVCGDATQRKVLLYTLET